MKLTNLKVTFPALPSLAEIMARSTWGNETWLTLWDIKAKQELLATTTDPEANTLKAGQVLRLTAVADGKVDATPVTHRQLSWSECWHIVTGPKTHATP